MKPIKIITPVDPDGINLTFSIIVNCGETPVQFSLLAEYDFNEHDDRNMIYRSCLTANAMEALPLGYDQQDVTAEVEMQAKYWTPLQIEFKPTN